MITDEESETFVEYMKDLIPTLESRNIQDLRPKVIKIIKKITADRGKKLEENAFSKNFWYRMLKRYPILRDLWEMLPNLAKKPKTSNNNTDNPPNYILYNNSQILYPVTSGFGQNLTIPFAYQDFCAGFESSDPSYSEESSEQTPIKKEEDGIKIEYCKTEPTENIPFQFNNPNIYPSFITKKEEDIYSNF